MAVLHHNYRKLCGDRRKMTEQCKETVVLLKLMRAAMSQIERLPWVEGCSEEKLLDMITRQSLLPLVYPVVEAQEQAVWKRIRSRLEESYHQEIHKAFIQEYEIQHLLDAMEQDGIDCLPMKGWIMRNYYPDPITRSMCDFDVLLKEFDSRKMQVWMEKQGYVLDHFEDDGLHDVYVKRPYMVVELHRSLVDKRVLQEQTKAYAQEWIETLWSRSVQTKGKKHIYYLKREDFYIHHLHHMHKHFIAKGTGIRSLADIYVFLRKEKAYLDQNYVMQELEALHLWEFAQSMERISKACFETGRMDKDSILVAEFLTEGGMYGSRENSETIKIMGKEENSFMKNKLLTGVKNVFPSADVLQGRYYRLKDHPWLLPFYWIIRAGRIFIWERNKIALMRKARKKEQYEKMKDIFRAAGIKQRAKDVG
ncbi:MAG: nucleotidyltransferase family protein [Eubacteriales bacterium]|nr:nucleotidyltransferase family protein [Eubacteriales bacterium]